MKHNMSSASQVPHLPDFFLARGDSDCLSTLAEHSLNDGAQSQALGPLLVYSPYLMERSKQQCLAERATKSCITSQKDLAEFLIKLAPHFFVAKFRSLTERAEDAFLHAPRSFSLAELTKLPVRLTVLLQVLKEVEGSPWMAAILP